MKQLFALILLLCFVHINKFVAQTTVASGDMSFIGFNTSGIDGVSFVTFVNVCPGTVLFITKSLKTGSGRTGM